MKKIDVDVVKKDSEHYINFDLTIKDVIAKIKEDFPASFKDCQNSDFVTKSRVFVDSLVSFPGKLDQILKTIPSKCRYCDVLLHNWKHKGGSNIIPTIEDMTNVIKYYLYGTIQLLCLSPLKPNAIIKLLSKF